MSNDKIENFHSPGGGDLGFQYEMIAHVLCLCTYAGSIPQSKELEQQRRVIEEDDEKTVVAFLEIG